jgi:hypothetical protein
VRTRLTYSGALRDPYKLAASGEPAAVRAATEERLLGRLVAQAERAMLRDPALRACETCQHFTYKPCCESGSDTCGCKGLSACAANAFLSWRSGGVHRPLPNPDGSWTTVIDHRINCPEWALSTYLRSEHP